MRTVSTPSGQTQLRTLRQRRRAIVVLAGNPIASDRPALALSKALGELGIEAIYLGRVQSPRRIAASVADRQADAVELCLGRSGGVLLLRELLRELIQMGRRDVSIVVHRVE